MGKDKTVQIGVRFPEDVVTLIDEFVEDASAELVVGWAEVDFNRTTGIRQLVVEALRARGYVPKSDVATKIASRLRKGESAQKITRALRCRPEDVEFIRTRISAGGERLPGSKKR